MTNFPSGYDDDVTLPYVNDNIVEIGAEAINAQRDAIFALEQEVGLGASGTAGSIAQRLSIILNPDGSLKPSSIASLGLVTLPITNSQIDVNAQILESKLQLDYSTQDLYNYTANLSQDINTVVSWISLSGIKLEPHISGSIYRHDLNDIDVSQDYSAFLRNKFRQYRDNSNLYNLLSDINSELTSHQFADGSSTIGSGLITTNDGSTYSSDYAHTASGIFLDTSRFAIIPKTTEDIQKLADFIDSANMFLYGTRIQNLYTNGISRSSRSNSFNSDINGQNIVISTSAIAYLLYSSATSPVDDIDHGDDIIEFTPSAGAMSNNTFDAQFASIKPGDIITINYGIIDGYTTAEVPFIIKEKKLLQGTSKRYFVRINGKNLYATEAATARVDKPLFNNNKYGVLAVAPVNNHNGFTLPSLIVGNPRSAMALGLGFDAAKLSSLNYMLYLVLYPTGNPIDGYTILPGIDVTGNLGITPGKYTLDSVVENINNAFRQPGYNYRFIAFSYGGEVGIMLADTCNNSAFSIVSAVVDSNGNYSDSETQINFPYNVVSVFSATPTQTPIDPLGFGPNAANIATPLFMSVYGSTDAASKPTKIFVPLKKNNYYVNGAERDRLALEENQILDGYGDGYWVAEIISRTENPSAPPDGKVEVTYRINNLDLSTTGLKPGKTIVVQSLGSGGIQDCGRFIIQSINFGCAPLSTYTDITVYDAIHGQGTTPVTSASSGNFAIYFGYDSVSFNLENSSDFSNYSPFKRLFEVYINQEGKTFTHERARISVKESLPNVTVNGVSLRSTLGTSVINLINVSPKFRGYVFGTVTKVSLTVSANVVSGAMIASLSTEDGYHSGPIVYGKVGEILRVYDETNIDYVEILIPEDTSFSTFSNEIVDIQLYPTLSLDEEIMLLAKCQIDNLNVVKYLRDERQFGNTSEKDFSTSAIDFISSTDKAVHANNVISGFDLLNTLGDSNPNDNQIYLTGGTVLVNGRLIQKNNETVIIPKIREFITPLYYNVNWLICVNDKAEYVTIPMLDYDPVLVTPASSNRRFTAFDPITLGTYYIEASTFSNIVNNRKDLTPLYIVASIVNYPYSTLTISDCRRFGNDIEDNMPLVYNSKLYQSTGNYNSADSIFTWLKYNKSFNGNVILKSGASNLNINSAVSLGGTNSSIVIDGQNETNLVFNSTVTFESNVTFKNINIRFNNLVAFTSGLSNVTFENCNIVITQTTSPSIIFDIQNASNISIDNCTITYTDLATSGVIFNLTNCSYIKVLNSNITTTFTSIPGLNYPGYVFILDSTTDTLFYNNEISGNLLGAIKLTGSSNRVNIDKCTITSSYDPQNDAYYNSYDLVLHGYAYVQGIVTGTLEDINITNTKFYHTHEAGNSNRVGFINFDLSRNTSVLNNIKISNCSFIDNGLSSSQDAIRSAVSIINTLTTPTTLYTLQPTANNIFITENYCNKNQLIIMSSVTDDDGYMNYPYLQAQNCIIKNNTCGTIGYWIGFGNKYKNIEPNTSSLPDQGSNLLIESNNCHYIAAMDAIGQYFMASRVIDGVTTNMCNYNSGYVTIKNNYVNWIHTSINYEDNSYLNISKNNLTSYDINFLNNFVENPTDPQGAINYAIVVIARKYTSTYNFGNGSSCIISENTTNIGRWMSTDLLSSYTTTYYGGIFTRSSAIITNNIIRGVDGYSSGAYHMISLGGKINICTHNQLYRTSSYSVGSYIGFYNGESPEWLGLLGSSGIVTENYLDTPYTDIANTNENVFDLPFTLAWTVERNINQTVTRILDFAYARHMWNSGGGSYKYYMNSMPTGVVCYKTSSVLDQNVNTIDYTASTAGVVNYTMKFDLSNIIPIDTYLTKLNVSVTTSVLTGTPGTYFGTLIARTYVDTLSPPERSLATSTHIFSPAGETYEFNLEGILLYIYSNKQSNDKGFLSAEFALSMNDATDTIDMSTTFSGLLVKYRW